jgi:magnesium transporter
MINEVLSYPEYSAGSLMTVEYVSLRPDMTVEQAFKKIRRVGIEKETIYTCYVTDDKKVLLGVVTAKRLMLADPDDIISDLMETNVMSCKTTDDGEEVAHIIEKYGFIALPVVDNENRQVGIITFDDAMDVIKEETSEDIMKMAAVAPSDDTYFKTSVLTHSKNRLIWLIVLMISATFTGLIITEYENAMTALLVSFIPMLMGTAGNSGTQSSAIIIRSLATEEIKLKDFGKVIFKELRIALLVGTVLALANAARTWLLNIFIYHDPSGLVNEMFIVGLTLIGAVVTAKLLGCCLPMLAKRLRLDPALLASPLMTTLVDTVTVLLYFSIAVSII